MVGQLGCGTIKKGGRQMSTIYNYPSGYAFSIDHEDKMIRIRQKSAVIEFTFGDFSKFAECFIEFLTSAELIAFRKEMVIDPTTWPPTKKKESQ